MTEQRDTPGFPNDGPDRYAERLRAEQRDTPERDDYETVRALTRFFDEHGCFSYGDETESWSRIEPEDQILLEEVLAPEADAALSRIQAEHERAEDFRAEIVVDAFTAPDADWNTILDSLRARIRDLAASGDEARAALAEHEELRAGQAVALRRNDDGTLDVVGPLPRVVQITDALFLELLEKANAREAVAWWRQAVAERDEARGQRDRFRASLEAVEQNELALRAELTEARAALERIVAKHDASWSAQVTGIRNVYVEIARAALTGSPEPQEEG